MSEPQREQSAQDNIQVDANHGNFNSGPSYFHRAIDTEANDGRFTSVDGSVYSGDTVPTHPLQRPQQRQESASFFKESRGTRVNGGEFTAISGNLH